MTDSIYPCNCNSFCDEACVLSLLEPDSYPCRKCGAYNSKIRLCYTFLSFVRWSLQVEHLNRCRTTGFFSFLINRASLLCTRGT
ncbi:hypothetical protein Agabi119p4_7496 [Agaricus bisporus var. burnettii]|uniref:Uncharacterized protein n=1 Tax=Agaricus bisporus var. burnettii TaxID=192524 RepID=A0A8H7C866_AGABI|nr:hypothetical protein Agabi119p4_7496 [Agaricus bisporus var. burnettii]